jgi:hypothetical protein
MTVAPVQSWSGSTPVAAESTTTGTKSAGAWPASYTGAAGRMELNALALVGAGALAFAFAL